MVVNNSQNPPASRYRTISMATSAFRFVFALIITQLYIKSAKADGTGLIGYGKTLYNPTCTFACRNVIRKQTLACTPKASVENHGTAHNPVTTPPRCFVQDPAFLKTIALCIDMYCTQSDRPELKSIEDYWTSHLGTGTLGDYRYVPVLSYKDALAAAREDENKARAGTGNTTNSTLASIPSGLIPYEISSPLSTTTGGSDALNSTRIVSPVQWQLQYNYLSDFEVNEKGHSTMTIAIAVVAMALPIFLALFRFIPGSKARHALSYLKSFLIHPATFSKHYREPVVGVILPNRGQTLYILLISFLNLILLIAPYTITQPQASFTSRDNQLLSVVGNRAGTMAMGNVVALILFSSRNSVLLYLTDWSYGTYLLLHRWLGYWTVIHTVIHSCMLWSYYVKAGTYSAELLRQYWIWGIVATVAVCAIVPLSLLQVRQRFYEFFLASHVALSLVFLVAYYYHIWYVYTYNWGYEIWMFVAAGIWALERIVRVGRMVRQGSRTAVVSMIPESDGDYMQIEIEGKVLDSGIAYLCFPTLSWRFWETHPFSVSGCITSMQQELVPLSRPSSGDDLHEKGLATSTIVTTAVSGTAQHFSNSKTSFFVRTRSGITKLLANKAASSETKHARLRILIDGPYSHSGHVHKQLVQCSSILCIAGGVGITACLPYITQAGTKDTKLFWSSRKHGLVTALAPTLNAFPPNVKVETLIGQRFDFEAIIFKELVDLDGGEQGPLGIVVSGPPGLADDVRATLTRIARDCAHSRAYALVDEAFSW